MTAAPCHRPRPRAPRRLPARRAGRCCARSAGASTGCSRTRRGRGRLGCGRRPTSAAPCSRGWRRRRLAARRRPCRPRVQRLTARPVRQTAAASRPWCRRGRAASACSPCPIRRRALQGSRQGSRQESRQGSRQGTLRRPARPSRRVLRAAWARRPALILQKDLYMQAAGAWANMLGGRLKLRRALGPVGPAPWPLHAVLARGLRPGVTGGPSMATTRSCPPDAARGFRWQALLGPWGPACADTGRPPRRLWRCL